MPSQPSRDFGYLWRAFRNLRKSSQSIQELLCEGVLWCWSDFVRDYKSAVPKFAHDDSFEEVLAVVLNIELAELQHITDSLSAYKDKLESMQECIACQIPAR